MNRFWAVITGAAVLLHFAVGCCGHHAHQDHADAVATPSEQVSHSCGHRHHHDSHQEQDDGGPALPDGPSDTCHQDSCHVVLNGKVLLPEGLHDAVNLASPSSAYCRLEITAELASLADEAWARPPDEPAYLVYQHFLN